MRRFFAGDITEGSTISRIMGDEFVHLKKVLRLTRGEEVALFNGKGLELIGVIESIGRDNAEVKITRTVKEFRESSLNLKILQGLLKSDKPELIIQKATELGAKEVSFFQTRRTVPVASGKGAKEKRWQRAAIEAAKQCGRVTLPEINLFNDLDTALAGRGSMLKLALWEEERVTGLKEALKGRDAKNGVVVLVGPEGGLSAEDIEKARQEGFLPVSMGPRVLRAETAAIAVLSVIQYELGDAG
ncbi:MAG: 16S rRNA (uracil(1498)-N(3))-methyltransferase [Deltaproteobacteria bacterium]|nr:16S rRNA (uracil(1498)-N(3))-methyltransferase [Deltaproteobacteria bacterium]